MTDSPSVATGIRAILVTLILVAGFLYGGFTVFSVISQKEGPAESPPAGPRIAVRTLRAEREAYRDVLRGYGQVRALRTTDVAAQVTGLVEKIDARLEPGNEVKPGTDLVFIQREDFEDVRENARAGVEQRKATEAGSKAALASLKQRLVVARSEHEISNRRLKSLLELEESSSSARDDVDVQRLQVAAMARNVLSLGQQVATTEQTLLRIRQEILAAGAALRRAERDVARTRIQAPYTGRIVSRAVQPGARVVPGTLLFQIVDLDVIEVPVRIGASHMGEIIQGARARLLLNEDGKPVWTGKVARIAPTIDVQERTMTAYLEVRSGQASVPISPGTFVIGEIDGAVYEDVVVLPRTAMISGAAYVVEPDRNNPGQGIVRERHPRIRRLLPEVALIASGIESGEEVVVTNLEQMSDGLRVLITRPAEIGSGSNGIPVK